MRAVFLLLLLAPAPALAIPVVPNFTSGVLSSRTESKTKVLETITSHSYRTGYEYSAAGVGLNVSGPVNPTGTTRQTVTIQGAGTSQLGLDMSTRPTWSLATPGGAFQFAETYTAPGLESVTIIQREPHSETIVDSTSTFSQ